MSTIGRYVKATAKAGQGELLAERLLQVAEILRRAPGCELYVINRSAGDADVIWVTEAWRSQADLDASLEMEEVRPLIPEVTGLLAGAMERIDVVPLGGAGLPDEPPAGWTRLHLPEAEDVAAKFGYGEAGEARFPTEELGAGHTGISHQRLRPGKRQAFGHRHDRAEEVYVVLSGGGRMRIDDEEVELRPLDAIRVGPRHARAFEAGPEGLEYLAVGPRVRGDGEILPGWWGG